MRLPSDGELNKKKSSQASNMDDICHIIHVSRSSGTYSSSGAETRSMVSGVACGFNFTNGQIKRGGQTLLVDYDAILRVAPTQPIFITDEVQLEEKGNIMVSGTFRPASNPVVNSSVQHVQLKRIVS